MTTQDERMGLPSGSSALEDSLCHGRFQLQKQWDEFSPEPEPSEDDHGNPEDIDSDREAGRRIHLLYAGKECPEASLAEVDRAQKARRVDEAMKAKWLAQFDTEPIGKIEELRETRWWLRDELGRAQYSGQTDVVWIRKSMEGFVDVLVGDLKGLWGKHDPAPLNMQIRRYIALIAMQEEFREIRSASAYLNQPVRTMMPVLTTYDEDAIAQAVLEMASEVAQITDPNAKRTAGALQCHHCRAKLICPEFQNAESSIMKAIAVPVASGPPSKQDIEMGMRSLSGENLARFLAWRPALRDACDLAESEAKRRLRVNEDSVPGWRLWPNSPRAKIDDVNKIYTRCAEQFQIDGKEFSALCSITKVNLIGLVREKSGLKGEALDMKVKEILDGATHEIKVSPSLEKIA